MATQVAPNQQQGQSIANTNVIYYQPASTHGVQNFVQPQEMSRPIHFPKLHKVFGIVHIVFGGIIFILEIVGLCLKHRWYITYQPGSGIWCGLFLGVTGLLEMLTGLKNSRCCLIAGLVMDIITSIILLSGVSSASIELAAYNGMYYSYNYTPNITYTTVKAGIVITICLVTFVTTIIHSGFGCYESCCRRQYSATTSVQCNPPVTVAYYNPQMMYPSQSQGPVPLQTIGMQGGYSVAIGQPQIQGYNPNYSQGQAQFQGHPTAVNQAQPQNGMNQGYGYPDQGQGQSYNQQVIQSNSGQHPQQMSQMAQSDTRANNQDSNHEPPCYSKVVPTNSN